MPARFLYQLTILVQSSAEAEWNTWHEDHHMRAVLKQPGFRSARKFKLVDDVGGGPSSYLVQYELDNADAYARYVSSGEADRLQREHDERFGGLTSSRFGNVTTIERKTFTEIISMKKEIIQKGERIWDSSHLTRSRKS